MISPRPLRFASALAVTAAVALATSSCAAPPARGGAAAPAPALRSVYGNGPGSVGADALRALLEDRSSPVQLTDVTDSLRKDGTTDSDGDAIAALRAGDADIAVIRSGRLAKAGATAMLAVQAPMVVTNDAQAAKAAADPEVLTVLDSLRRIGLVGLALVPGGDRHPFGYKTALTQPDQFAGATINTRSDANVDALMTALGAEVDHSVDDERTRGAASGRLRGIEVAFGQQAAVDRPAVVSSNVVLYQKFDVIVMRQKAFDTLDAATQKRIRAHAMSDARSAVAARESESRGLTRWCSQAGGASVVVGEADIDALRAKVQPVVEHLRQDPTTAAILDRLAALHLGTVDPAGQTCAGAKAPSTDPFTLKPVGSQSVLDGEWRTEVSAEDLSAVGASQQDAQQNAGVWTFRIRNGLAQVDQPHGQPCTMRFTIAGDQVVLDEGANGNDACYGMVRGTFSVTGNEIRFVWTAERDYDVALDNVFFGVLTRVTG